jgi:hypothetical protein
MTAFNAIVFSIRSGLRPSPTSGPVVLYQVLNLYAVRSEHLSTTVKR